MVRYRVERHEQIDAGARIAVRRIGPCEGSRHRPGTEGFRLLPVGAGRCSMITKAVDASLQP
jgi:hypothetical protein